MGIEPSPSSQLRARTRESIQNLLGHEFFSRLKGLAAKPSALRTFAEQYAIASAEFPIVLCLAGASLGDDRIRATIIENLWDEHGQGNIEKSHREMLRRFLEACGADLAPAQALPSTSQYILGMKRLASSSNEAAVLGALGPGCEEFTVREYRLVIAALRDRFNEAELSFFYDHVRHDGGHVSGLNEAIDSVCDSQEQLDVACTAATEAIALEYEFWTGILKAMETESPVDFDL
jgi:pyrroloquinoline-quinone synthase